MLDAYLVFAVLLLTITLFIWGYWRYDTVALIALLSLVLLGIIPPSEAFIGFSNPAVITVAAVMILTKAISQSGLVEQVVKHIEPLTTWPTMHITTLTLITAILSAFMNNVGALALMMPIAINSAFKAKLSPSYLLMPMSFASVLGGLCTKIGTPPNLLISAYREELTGNPYAMFDFSPVGFTIAAIGVAFIALIGWRLLPERQKAEKESAEQFPIHDYISEIQIPEDSPFVGKNCYQIEHFTKGDYSILGIIRNRKKRLFVPPDEILAAKDILIIEASHDDLHQLVEAGKLSIAGGDIVTPESLRADDIAVLEAVVTPGSRSEGRSWQRMRIRSRLQVNLLAIARSGRAFRNRLNHVNLHAGDIVLLQGSAETLQENVVNLGLVPLAERDINIGFRRKMLLPLIIFLTAIICAATQLLTVSVAFTAAIIIMVLINIIPMRSVYRHVDWSIITLLAAMIPVGGALQSSGATHLISNGVLLLAGPNSPSLIIFILLLTTMSLSDIMNNAATAVVMAPIANSIAQSLHMPLDPFLMAVAVGASCSFLTPISHQNNTLVMGPGGYKFYDFLRLGIPIELIVLILGVPLITHFWL